LLQGTTILHAESRQERLLLVSLQELTLTEIKSEFSDAWQMIFLCRKKFWSNQKLQNHQTTNFLAPSGMTV